MRTVALVVLVLVGLSGCGGDGEAPRPTSSLQPEVTLAPTDAAAEPFDPEAWRQGAIEEFGPETVFQDGTKLDYVRVAEEICALEERPAYEAGSLQDHIVETYCPHA